MIAKIRKSSRSKTIKWGHVQMVAGAAVVGLGFVTPEALPNLPVWAYGVAAMISAVITYILRAVTTQPLNDGQGDAK